MEKRTIKYIQTENPKSSKKLKDMKFLTNYVPIKKVNGQSNISEYETESSIQKNFSNKVQKNKNLLQVLAKSVKTSHNNQMTPKKNLSKNKKDKIYQRQNKSSRGSLYNLNNLNLGDYFSEKIVMTRQKFIDYKDNKINTLMNELSLIKKELAFYEQKNSNININNINIINNINSNNNIIIKDNINNNNKQRNKSNILDKNMNNINQNKNNIEIKTLYINGNGDKIMLENNSYASFNIFHSNEILCNNINNIDNADKKLKKHLSSLLNDNFNNNVINTANFNNINIKSSKNDNNINIGKKHKNKKKKNKKNLSKDMNKKNLLNAIYLSKKGCFNHANNNYDHNTNNNIIINKEKNNEKEKGINHELHFYANIMKEKDTQLKENLTKKEKNSNNNKIQNELQNLSERMNNIFNSFFDYYEKK